MSQQRRESILIIRLSAIGDVVVTTPVSRALREARPDAHIAWVVERGARDVVSGNPYLDEVIVWDRQKGGLKWRDLAGIRAQLRTRRWDWAIDCQGLLRSALLARLSGARRIVGNTHAKERADWLYHVKVPRSETDLSSRRRCLDLLQPLGIHSTDRRLVLAVSEDDRAAGRLVLAGGGIGDGQRYACLVPATTWAQKHWLEESWSELADILRQQLGVIPVIMGGPADIPLAERIAGASRGGCVVAAGKTSLKSAAALLAGADFTVAVDTGLLHSSVAVGTPTVGLCGASWWHGFQDYENFELLREEMKCSPCVHHPTCDGRFDCMRALTPERVLAAVRRLRGSPLAVLT
ncbi:MAG: glycosyltransferase family 9 protein [Actinomycetota bacterium]